MTDEQKQAGRHQIMLDTSRLPSGVYFYHLDAEDVTITRKITVVH
ncbi:MAG: T9SS type A sorting domain-containing protein [Salinibacter sp.]